MTVKRQKPATINRKLAAPSAFCRRLLAQGIVKADPVSVKMTQRKGKAVVQATLGKGEGYREVPLNTETHRALREYLAVRPKFASDRFFIGQRGPLTESSIWRIVTKYARQAGVEASPHVLHHGFAALLARQKKTDSDSRPFRLISERMFISGQHSK